MGKSLISLSVAAFVTAIALGFGWFASAGRIEMFGYPALYITSLAALLINWLAFVPAAIKQSDTYYDSVGALTYISVTLLAVWGALQASGVLDLRAMVAAGLVIIWCSRLGTFLFSRIHASGGTDERFAKIKTNPARFLVAWTLQALWVVLTAAGALAIILAADPQPLGAFFFAGLTLWVIGFAFEVIGDNQKKTFKADPANKGKYITTGLWGWTQHPNYFGEITLWTGMLVMAIPVLSGLSWLVVISPLFVFMLLTRISGINLLNAIGDERWGDDPEYQAYRKNVPVLFPRPPRG